MIDIQIELLFFVNKLCLSTLNFINDILIFFNTCFVVDNFFFPVNVVDIFYSLCTDYRYNVPTMYIPCIEYFKGSIPHIRTSRLQMAVNNSSEVLNSNNNSECWKFKITRSPKFSGWPWWEVVYSREKETFQLL